MARSSAVDAIEKFRFNVFIFDLAFDPVSLLQNKLTFLRGGFSEVTLPRQTTTAIEYRENTDAAHFQIIPGLTRYEPVQLRRGVTKNSDFLRWANQVHDPTQIVATTIQRFTGDAYDSPPSESMVFRRDVMIVSYNRAGEVAKAWILRDAWASGYKPGDDLSATEDGAKLIEELELRYESFEELTLDAVISGSINDILGAL